MSSISNIKADVREVTGTGAARASRVQNQVPAVVYGAGKSPIPISVSMGMVEKELRSKGILTRVFDLEVAGSKKSEKAIIKDIQFHPVSGKVIHIDFMRVMPGHKINIKIPLHFINDMKSPALKQGGVLNIIDHMLDASCSVDSMVDHIDIDLTGLGFHDTIKIKNLNIPSSVTLLRYDSEHTVATIVAPSSVRSEVAGQSAENNSADKPVASA